ncbi:hypothetical protein [Mycolicibacillus koreensis]|uniref:Uncharacterized protein n=1 Tax=Mycolicibacillus koreensis TaxID=1069220 RepID=A0A7I7SBD4_9MYCO|nr:hypothetical protein [Mycolicibacillus koreensis]OSC29175.1 hypothetical protein B8W67_17430 [Mycolicibacillus koreensis]BBY53295.1 hypothetical protein MKOR_05460 [Mycolicibacillus koreensis]
MLDWFRQDIVDGGRLPLLCCLVAFLATFLITRITVRYIRNQNAAGARPRWWQPRNVHLGTKHIHHVVFGVVLVLVSGVGLVVVAGSGHELAVSVAAIGFGIGAALVLDEYALILHLADVYWEEDGRTSVDAVFAATAVTGLLVLGFHPLTFLLSLWHDTSSLIVQVGVFSSLVLALPLAVVVLFKGKVWTGLVGMFFFPLLVIGAVRLSRPHAPWARWRYHGRPQTMRRALERERQLRRPVVRAKLWLQDAIAGRPQVHDDVTVTAAVNREVRVASAPTEPIMIRRIRPTRAPSAAADRAAAAPTVPIARLRTPGEDPR